MKIFLAFLIPIFIAFTGYHLSFRGFRAWSVGGRFFFTGSEFLVFGLLLGPGFLNILDETTTRNLEPLKALITGWIGLLYGLQFEWSHLKNSPPLILLSSMADALLTFAMTLAGSYLLLPLLFESTGETRVMISILLASAAACSSQTGISQVRSGAGGNHGEILNVLKYISSLGGVTALLMFAPVFIFRAPLFACSTCMFSPLLEVVAVVMVNTTLLILYSLLFSQEMNRSELALVVIGMVVLTSGTAAVFKFSPLLANFVIGLFIANSSRHKNRIFNILINIEKPLYLLLIVLLGSMWRPGTLSIIIASLCYCALRVVGKATGGGAVAWINRKKTKLPLSLGTGLLEQGGLALAILMDFTQFAYNSQVQIIVSVVLTAIILNDLLCPFMLGRLFRESRQGGGNL